MDANIGETIWHIGPTPVAQGGSPSISGSTMFAPGSDGVIRALDIDTGAVKWASYGGFHPKGITGLTSSTAVDEIHGWVLGAADNGRIFVLDKNTGQLVRDAYLGVPDWNPGDPEPLDGFWFAGSSSMAIVPSQTLLYIAGTDFDRAWKGMFNKGKEKLFCYNYGGLGSEIELVWEYQFCADDDECEDLDSQHIVRGWDEQITAFYTLPSPALADGHVYYNSFNGKVYCFGSDYVPCPVKELYGEQAEETKLIRNFRDNVLDQSLAGQEIIKLYRELSPVIVKVMKEDEEFRAELKAIIDGLLPLIR